MIRKRHIAPSIPHRSQIDLVVSTLEVSHPLNASDVVGWGSVIRARVDAFSNIEEWLHIHQKDAAELLAELLGYVDYHALAEDHENLETYYRMKALSGPNGYTMFRMLQARMDNGE